MNWNELKPGDRVYVTGEVRPECHGAIDRADHFCKHCGQAVKE